MALTPGTRLGPYEVTALIGKGGMGEVHRARDSNLGRDVAIKVLPDAFAHDPERLARFELEAKTLASLNHLNIAIVYGLEKADGIRALVMELVEGPTLADRIARGAIPVNEALPIAKQVCEALEAAHEAGVVHRDLKPANIKLRPDGVVKVLDFGLAKLNDPNAPKGSNDPNASQSPTLSLLPTQAGVILGTAPYMSPEQAKGLPADRRSDVFSFGVVLYEMLTGRRPFQGDTTADVLASVLAREPDMTALAPNLNPRVLELVKRCLDKNPRRRWQAAGDLRVEIEIVADAPWAAAPVVQRPRGWTRVLPVAAAALVATAITAAALRSTSSQPAPPSITRFSVPLGENERFRFANRQSVAISPDGAQIVYNAADSVYLRSMSDLDAARRIPEIEAESGGLERSVNPVFSPDGRSIVFFAGRDGTLKRVPISGGAAVTLCAADLPYGMSWSDDSILFGQASSGIMRVSANGGAPEVLVAPRSGELSHGPQLLPGGRAVLFTVTSEAGDNRWDRAQIVVQSLESGERTLLVQGGSDARYLPTGHLVYARGTTLFAVPFDLQRLEVTGPAVPIAEGVARASNPDIGAGMAQFSVSPTGSLVYIPSSAVSQRSAAQGPLAFVDLRGAVQPLRLPPAAYEHVRVSPDGSQLAYDIDDGKEAVVWMYDLAGTTTPRRLTFGGNNRFPIWSADGQRIAFQSDREGDRAIFWQRADGADKAERLTKPGAGASHVPESWSPDNTRFTFAADSGRSVTLWTFSLQDKSATRFGDVESLSVATSSVFSPDGRWVAYTVRVSGTPTLFVEPFPPTGAKYQLSAESAFGLWSQGGKELLVRGYGGSTGFSAVGLTMQPVVLNWHEELKRLVPVN